MNTNIDFYLSFLLLAVSLWALVRNIKKFSVWNSFQIFILLPSAAGLVVSALSIAFYLDILNYLILQKVQGSAFLLLWSSLVTFLSLLSIRQVTAQKVKVLWRIPILGLLAGAYFEWKYIGFIVIGYFILFAILVLRNKDLFASFGAQLFFISPLVMYPFFHSIQTMGIFFCLFIYFYIITQKINECVNIKGLLKNKVGN